MIKLLNRIPDSRKIMKEVAILLLAALLLNGCSTSTSTTVQTPVGNGWQAAMSGGEAPSSTGFSFNTFFTVGSGGALSISSTQLLNSDTCFGTSNVVSGGTLNITAVLPVTGTFSFTLTSSAGDVVTLTSNDVTGTVNSTTNVLSNGVIIGTWVLVPASGSACVTANGSFTMTQSAS
jgi:hypothetical protein